MKKLKTAAEYREANRIRVANWRRRHKVKVIRIGGPKYDPNDQLMKASEPASVWKDLESKNMNLAGQDSPVFRTRTFKKWGNAPKAKHESNKSA